MTPQPVAPSLARSGPVDELQEVQITAQYMLDEVQVTAKRIDVNPDGAIRAGSEFTPDEARQLTFLQAVEKYGLGGEPARFDTFEDFADGAVIATAGPSTRMGPRSLVDPNLWRKAGPTIANNGIFQFSDGSLDVSIFNENVELVPIVRSQDELFSDTARNAFQSERLDLLVNANQYELLPGAGQTIFTNMAVDPDKVRPIGLVVENGSVVAGRSSPETFYISQTRADAGVAYTFGFGNAPLDATAAFGGGVPLIIDGLRYGAENSYVPGTPPSAPLTGSPGAYAANLTQRSSAAFATYTDRESQGYYGTGKVIVAHSAESNALAVVVQRDGAANGVSLGAIRDDLYRAGFKNAIAFDGSDSATLMRAGRFVSMPAYLKDATIPAGIGIRRPQQ